MSHFFEIYLCKIFLCYPDSPFFTKVEGSSRIRYICTLDQHPSDYTLLLYLNRYILIRIFCNYQGYIFIRILSNYQGYISIRIFLDYQGYFLLEYSQTIRDIFSLEYSQTIKDIFLLEYSQTIRDIFSPTTNCSHSLCTKPVFRNYKSQRHGFIYICSQLPNYEYKILGSFHLWLLYHGLLKFRPRGIFQPDLACFNWQ